MNNTLEETRTWFWNLLARRPCTRQEALERLSARGLPEEENDCLLDEAQALGLLDDALYARLFAEGHEAWGNDRIAWELRRRGVPEEPIQAALEDGDEAERARALAESWRGLEPRKIEARLRRRGFSGRAIRAACRGGDDDGDVPW